MQGVIAAPTKAADDLDYGVALVPPPFSPLPPADATELEQALTGVDYHVPFGGRKGSSFGPREQGRFAAEFYTTVKTSYVFSG